MASIAAIREELETLITGGVIYPVDVVNAARNPNSAMHSQFEWDDGEAAEAWRLQQARTLIRRVKVNVVRTDDAVVHIPSFIRATNSTGGYYQTQVVVGTPNHLRAAAITLSQVSSMLKNLGMPEVDAIISDVERVRADVLEQLREEQAAEAG